ncbi:DUF4198 domain-containing protein [Sphingobacterium suaedae]|uniref:DUF4198 domain-containing protein n=1 Tax=Sphingobacterium suaedae TaxID=1686402 RepID=A0ABW5KDR1_9SPHI
MKSTYYFFLCMIALLGGQHAAQAHAIWLESDAFGTKGKAQQVRVYYGEYATGEMEKTADWYSDLRSIEVYVLKPDQSAVKLTLEDKGDYFESTFTPEADGNYLLYTTHPAKDLGGQMRYEFTSQIAVQVGGASELAAGKLPYQLMAPVKKHRAGGQVTLVLTKDGQPVKDQDVLVMTSAGWSKTYKTDAQGQIQVEALWPGNYVAEYSHVEKVGGSWHGKEYTSAWQGLTTSFKVN